jgi:hypothetical protein
VLESRTWRHPVKHAGIAAAYLLRVYCGLFNADVGLCIGRSDQTVSDLSARLSATADPKSSAKGQFSGPVQIGWCDESWRST